MATELEELLMDQGAAMTCYDSVFVKPFRGQLYRFRGIDMGVGKTSAVRGASPRSKSWSYCHGT